MSDLVEKLVADLDGLDQKIRRLHEIMGKLIEQCKFLEEAVRRACVPQTPQSLESILNEWQHGPQNRDYYGF